MTIPHGDDEEDEDEVTTTPGRPNAYWAQVREEERTGFGADYRAVPQVKHGGSQNVTHEHLLGSYDECWCGLPEGHDWPGKVFGRRHPEKYTREELMTHAQAAQDNVPHITRSDLRGFGDNYTELILKAVNEYGTRYRLNNRGIMLYPKDGAEPYSLAMRENNRTLKAVRIWFIRHIADLETETAKRTRPSKAKPDEDLAEAARRLAEKLNSPEHPVPEPKPADATPAPAPTKEEAVAATSTEESAPEEATPEEPSGTPLWVTTTRDQITTREVTPGWHILRNWKNQEIPYFETDGSTTQCLVLTDGQPCTYTGNGPRGASGHFLTTHSDEGKNKLYGPDAMRKKLAKRERTFETRVYQEDLDAITQGLLSLSETLGVTLNLAPAVEPVDITDLQQQIETLTKERDDLQQKYQALQKDSGDLKARLDLLREAMAGL